MTEYKNRCVINKSKKITPIRPEQICVIIPDFVIEGTNECIMDNYKQAEKKSRFTQDVLIDYILKKVPEGCNINRKDLFKNNWLDIEPFYEKVGWKVIYDKPAYYEMRSATFTFIAE